MDSTKKLTRRAVLGRGAALGLVVFGGGALSACGGGGLDCSNPPGLSPAERTQRQALGYVDQATNPSQRCEVCTFFTAPAEASTCGGCTLNLGPVNPQGYCSSFVARS